MDIQQGFRVVFCIEEQNVGKVKHISISVDAPNKLPNMEAVALIVDLFGIEGPITSHQIWTENIGPNHQAINIVALDKP